MARQRIGQEELLTRPEPSPAARCASSLATALRPAAPDHASRSTVGSGLPLQAMRQTSPCATD
jgi:hypothetical protein